MPYKELINEMTPEEKLFLSADRCDINILLEAVKSGADINHICKRDGPHILNKETRGKTAFTYTLEYGTYLKTDPNLSIKQDNEIKVKYIEKLLELSADPDLYDENNHNPLMFVSFNFSDSNSNLISKKIIEILFKYKADPNAKCKRGTTSFISFCSSCNFLLLKDKIKILDLYLKNNANISIKSDNKITPIYLLCKNKEIELIEKLIQHKINLNPIDVGDRSPINQAGKRTRKRIEIVEHDSKDCKRSIKLVKLLLKNGIDTSIIDTHNWYPECVKILNQYLIEKLNTQSDQEFNL